MKIIAWLNVLVGIWLVLSPFVLGFPMGSRIMWGNLISGILVISLSLILTANSRA